MKIGIDARMYGLEHAGIGRYIKNLTTHLFTLGRQHHFVMFVNRKQERQLDVPDNVTLVRAFARHYSFSEQLLMPYLFARHQCDLYHIPHFNVPLAFNRPFVVTIHDILWHHQKGSQVTTLSPLMYRIKYQGYKLTVKHAVKSAAAIITPSQWVADQLKRQYPQLNPNKVRKIYEGVDENLLETKADETVFQDHTITTPYVVYIGSAYPHKNLKRLIQAIGAINQQQNRPLNLVIVSSRSVFLGKIKSYVKQLNLNQRVTLTGFLPDNQLKALLLGAQALVQPSLSEGFGLPGIEAMNIGVPVASSNAAALPEIYQQAAIYFDPQNVDEMAQAIAKTAQSNTRKTLIKQGKQTAQTYDWQDTARQTLDQYEQVANP